MCVVLQSGQREKKKSNLNLVKALDLTTIILNRKFQVQRNTLVCVPEVIPTALEILHSDVPPLSVTSG